MNEADFTDERDRRRMTKSWKEWRDKVGKEGGYERSLSDFTGVTVCDVDDVEISNGEETVHLTYRELRALIAVFPDIKGWFKQHWDKLQAADKEYMKGQLQVLDKRLVDTKKIQEKLKEEREFLVEEIENSNGDKIE
jgi:hypothetical protein